MDRYLYAIKTGILLFPILAVIITIPYIIHQYRKYGSLLFLRSVIIYSFILYLLIIYFLVILPLPPVEEVRNYVASYTQLTPFYSVIYLKQHITFSITNFETYPNLFFNSYFYQVIYNIFITIPFGIYLRYYFKFDFKKTLIYSFGLSLFFELTQLTGLYGIYPRPYRIFDVDDLITNTLGGCIGYALSPILHTIFPSRDSLDRQAYLKGKNISALRKIIAFYIDIFFFTMLMGLMHWVTKEMSILASVYVQFFLVWTIYFVILPIFTRGITIGRATVKIKLESIEGKLKNIQIIIRECLIFMLFVICIPIIKEIYNHDSFSSVLWLIILFLLLQFFYFFVIFISKRPFYERISKTKYISTILIKDEKSIKSDEKKSEITNMNVE